MIRIPPDALVEDAVVAHALDACFLWEHRERASSAPNYSLDELAALDARLQANLDGLQQAGPKAIDVFAEHLGEDAAAAFVLAFVSAGQGTLRFWETVDSLPEAPESITGTSAALTWLPLSVAAPIIDDWKSSELPSRRAIALRAAIEHRYDLGSAWSEAAMSEDLQVRALALCGSGELGREDMQLHLQRCFNDSDLACRFQARRSCLLLQMPDSAGGLIEPMMSDCPESEIACRLVMRHLPPAAARDIHENLAGDPSKLRLSVIGAGASGDPAYIPWILEAMAQPDHARVALDALVAITGVNVHSEKLCGRAPADFEEGPTSDPDDSNVEIPEDANLPWPAADAARTWWQKQGSARFQSGTSYLMGCSRSEEGLRTVLLRGNQRLRGVAAFELGQAARESATFNTTAPAARQKQLLTKVPARAK